MQRARSELNVADVAELPELLRSTRVLEEHLIDVEPVQLTAAEAVNRLGYVRDKPDEVRLVVARHRPACLPTLQLLAHSLRLTRTAERANARTHR